MRRLALVDSSVAIAQPAGSRNPPSMNLDQQSLPEAPVGHRQPRADQVPSEKNLMNPNDPVNQENAALDRMINGIRCQCVSCAVLQGPVECVEVDRDRYKRAVSVCTVGGADIADWLVRNGLALDWPQYSKGGYAAA